MLSRSEVKVTTPDEPYVVISITNPGIAVADVAISPYCRGILRLQFHDISDDDQPLQGKQVMSEEEGRQVIAFFQTHAEKVGLIVCQCEAGVSRSAAVAAALCRLLQGDDAHFFAGYSPNRWVYRTVLDAAGDTASNAA
ncbi:MAG TPA: hypothetical protein VFW40_06040 [Capsulimonadaceae bacterium]|nr:hypothetical protein [Capsulimonadaceae bacterium]